MIGDMSKRYQVVIASADDRMKFWPVNPDWTLEEVYAECASRFPSTNPARWLESENVDIQVADSREHNPFWTLHRRLKGLNPGPSFADVVRDSLGLPRPYEYGADPAIPLIARELMKPDPVIQQVLDQYGFPADENDRPSMKVENTAPDFYPPYPTGTPVANFGRSNAANSLRIRAANKRREADNLEQLAKVADELKLGSPEEAALWDLINGVR